MLQLFLNSVAKMLQSSKFTLQKARHKYKLIIMTKKIILCLIFFFLCRPLYAKSTYLQIKEIFIESSYLVISLELKDWHCLELQETIQGTIPVEFNYRLRLYRHKTMWFNDRAYSKRFRKQVYFEKKTRQFIIDFDNGRREDSNKRSFSNFNDMAHQIDSFKIYIHLDDLDIYSKRKAFIRVRANMTERYELFRIPGSFRTSWLRSEYFTLYELHKKSRIR